MTSLYSSRGSLLAILFIFSLSFSFAQPCIDGFSGDYPCDKVDQLAFMDLDEFDSDNINDIWGWTSPITNREYAIVGFHNKTAFIDMTTPTYPLYLGYLPTATTGSLWRDVKVVGHHCYIVSEASGHGMQVFDLTRLEDLQAAETPFVFNADSYYDAFGHCHNIVADEENEHVYAVGSSTFGGGLHIIDVSNPDNLVYAGSDVLGGYVHDAQVLTYNGPDADYVGKEICIGFNADFLVIYDVSDKTDIEVISVTLYENVGYVHQGWLTADSRYMLSNDETDELDFGLTTRRIVWDLIDLDDPQVINYVDFENTSIDHNLYIDEDMVYESNYTSGLRILDDLEIADGILEPFGFFDVVPQTDLPLYIGSWSNYPYFESGVVPVTNMYIGLHLLDPQYFQLSTNELLVCNTDDINLEIVVNKRIFGAVQYAVEMEEVSGLIPELALTETDGAPATNSVQWYGLAGLAPGYYPGEIVISYDLGEARLPFVLIREESDQLFTPELISPENEELVPSQLVDFEIVDNNSGYGVLQVALDSEFAEIVYEETLYDEGTSFSAYMPYNFTTYFWRVVKPTSCGEDIVSPTGSFTIDITSGLEDGNRSTQAQYSIYPNPVSGQLFIQGLANNAELGVYDIAGRKVAAWKTIGNVELQGFDVSNLKSGIYIIRASNAEFAGKFVKK